MATTLENFASEGFLTTSAADIFSTNASEKKFIGNITLTNTGTTSQQVYLWRLLTATTATTTEPGGNFFSKFTIPAGKTVRVDKLVGHVLGPSMSIKGQAATASTVSYNASGTTEV